MVIGCIVLAKQLWFTMIELSGFCFTSMPIYLNILQFTEPILKTLHSLSMTLTWRASLPSGNWNSNGDQLCSIAC